MSFAVSSPPSPAPLSTVEQPPDPFLLAADMFDPPGASYTPEWHECEASSATFIERHCTIEEPNGTVLPFTLWNFQRDTLTDLENEQAIIVLKARRLGLSWVVLAFALWLAIFNQGLRILILCKTGDDAAELLDRIRRMRDRIYANPDSAPVLDHLQTPDKSRDAVTTLDIGASTIRALMGTPAAARSETAGFVILDEFAFQRGASEIWRAVQPTIEGGGRLAAVSTGNGPPPADLDKPPTAELGVGGEFAYEYRRAKTGRSPYKAIFWPWMARPDRDQAWKTRALKALGDAMRFRIEYPEVEDDAFLVADADLIYPGEHIDAAEKLGTTLDTNPDLAPGGPLYLGIDWGVNTHMIFGRRLPSGGLYAMREVFSTNADIEEDVTNVLRVLEDLGDPEFLRHDPGGPGAKVTGSFIRQVQDKRATFKPRRMKIPFSKYKVVAIRYVKLLLRRASEDQLLRVAAISPTGCPELLRQMRKQEWKNIPLGTTEKGDDDGSDAFLTLAAELGYVFFKDDPDPDKF